MVQALFDFSAYCMKVKNVEIPSNQTKGTIKTQYPKDKTIT